jgi:hypothetical protein
MSRQGKDMAQPFLKLSNSIWWLRTPIVKEEIYKSLVALELRRRIVPITCRAKHETGGSSKKKQKQDQERAQQEAPANSL